MVELAPAWLGVAVLGRLRYGFHGMAGRGRFRSSRVGLGLGFMVQYG
jgi:hypothetical protein